MPVMAIVINPAVEKTGMTAVAAKTTVVVTVTTIAVNPTAPTHVSAPRLAKVTDATNAIAHAQETDATTVRSAGATVMKSTTVTHAR